MDCTIVTGDWYGLGNAIAIIASVVVQVTLINLRRHALDNMAQPETKAEERDKKIKTLLITLADGKMVTAKAPWSIVRTFTWELQLGSKAFFYHFVRWIGWTFSGAHILVLGMCTLFTQIYTVILLVLSTWLVVHDFDFDARRRVTKDSSSGVITFEISIGYHISVIQGNPTKNDASGVPNDRRMVARTRVST